MTAVVRAEGLRRRFNERDVVAGVSFELSSGEFVALVGPSGCGKTTLLHLLGLLERPDEGRVLIGDIDAWTLASDERAEIRLSTIGFVFQQSHLLVQLNVRDNVALPAWRIGGSRKLAVRRADAALEEVGLPRRGSSNVQELSGGEAQRVAIARAIVNEPQVVFADEPSGNLDAASTTEVLDVLAAVCARRATLLVVTHDPIVAGRAGRRLQMQDGRFVHA